MKKFGALTLVVLMLLMSAVSLAEGALVVYSPHDADPLQAGLALFQEAYPDIKVEYIAAGTGELLQRVAAESENPLADVLWGGGADSLAAFKPYFQPYVCANDDVIADSFKDAEDLWIGESPCPWCFSTTKPWFLKKMLPKPGKTCSTPNGRDRSLTRLPPSPVLPTPSCAR